MEALVGFLKGQSPNPGLRQSSHRITKFKVIRDTTESELETRRTRRDQFSLGNEPMNAVSYPKWMWAKGQAIILCFLDGNRRQHNFVRKCFGEYGINLMFKYVGPSEKEMSDVRITFKSKDNTFESLIGTFALEEDAEKPTMWLGNDEVWDKLWLPDADPDDIRNLRADILHEGLHMLGFGHEHKSPNCHIKWKVEDVYLYYKWRRGCGKKIVDWNVLNRHQAHEVEASEYDSKSIMHYAVDKSLTEVGFCVFRNYELSEIDKKKLGWAYSFKPQRGLAALSPTNLPIAVGLRLRKVEASLSRFLPFYSWFSVFPLSAVAAPVGSSHVLLALLMDWIWSVPYANARHWLMGVSR
jgi:hypothetical protein